MTLEAYISLATGVVTFLTALGSLLQSLRNGRALRKSQATGQNTAAKLEELHLTINSRLDQMLEAREAKGHAAGVKDSQEKIGT